jgi:hypothetical protein
MWHAWETGETHRGCSFGDLMKRAHLKVLGVVGRIILNWIFEK